jgi:hypothetical protein
MSHKRGITCQITAFEVPDPPSDPDSLARKWLAVATAHIYDPNIMVPGLKPGQATLAGETMRVVEGRAFADTEAKALVTALEGLLLQLAAKGYSSSDDVKLW